MKQLFNKTKSILILLLALSFLGCEEDDVTLPQVVAGFTHTIDFDTRTVTFLNTSTNATAYSWGFGDGTVLDEVNPIKKYPIGSFTIVLTASNVAGASDTYTDTIIFLDTEIPLITLIGDATVNVTLDDAYTDAGASALDAVDGDLTANIVVGGDTVDTAVEAIYTITYDVTDTQGNEAIQVTRTVNVAAVVCTDEIAGSISAADLNLTFMTDPTASITNDGADFSWITNPDSDNTVNPSCKVAQITKQGVNPWDNTQIDLDAKLDFTTNTGLKIKVWSAIPNTEVRLKLEEIGNSSNNVEQFLTTSVTNGWEELTFPYTSADSDKFDKIVMFFDLNADNSDTYYFDDLMLYGTGSGGTGGGCVAETAQSLNAVDINITFMSDPAAVGSGVTVIEDNATYEYVDNPDFSTAVNNSCKVGKVTKAGVESWDNIQIDFADKITFTDGSNFTIKVFSPVSGYKVTFKLEDQADGNINTEVSSTVSTLSTNAWEELTIPFGAADSAKYDKLVIFFDLAGAANTNAYYFDDIKLNLGSGGGGGGGTCPTPPAGEFIGDGDFEVNADCWVVFDNGGSATISTTVSNGGGTNSGQIQTAPGGNPGLKQERFGMGTILPNTTYVATFDIKASAADMLANGAVFQAFTFSEPADGSGLPAAQHVLIAGDANVTTTWVQRSYTFTTAANVDGGVSLLFELVCGGVTGCTGTINIDNVSITAQ
ncbi:immunoglobulin-like domain-containing protein [Lacinutrix jangbogonensis]|uniref:immunoglobulin-like domain-containing protein n=1 Tax=Lacinutrix jangbogonensis TaxID=1469557 RepID=UPI00068F4837|nr:immunoglobulin-like domain-containing protein [Lacinutrix jangbogonensis]